MLEHARILVADDDPELLSAVAEALRDLGAEVTRADNGVELIERLAQDRPFDLIVTDISMPWMSGLQAMHSARAAGLETAVVVMTALKDDALVEKVRALGENAALLRKPFDLAELEDLVAKLLSRLRAEARIEREL